MLTVADMLTTALTWHAAGYSVIPIKPDGSKQPALQTWRDYMQAQPDLGDVERWGRDYTGMGVVCGGLLGLEMLEVESAGLDTVPQAAQLMADNGMADVWDRIMHGYCERSPRGGLHWFLRVPTGARGNTKIARRRDRDGKVAVLWETRGQGGQTVIAPSNGKTSRDGVWSVGWGTVADIPVLTVEERDDVYAILAMLDEMPVSDEPRTETATPQHASEAGQRPGDHWNAKASWDDILIPLGWTKARPLGSGFTWRRPGKVGPGISATTGQASDGVDRLYVFSTSTEFESERPYTKFGAYALLEHHGNHSEAARALRRRGYGAPPPDVEGWVAGLPEAPPDAPGVAQTDDSGDPAQSDVLDFRIDWRLAYADEDRDVAWLVEGIIERGRLVAMYSAPKAGKSLLALEWAAGLASGRGVPGQQPTGEMVPVLYCDYENTPADIVDRLRDLGYHEPDDLAELHYLSLPVIPPLDTRPGGDALLAAAETVGAALVIVDTASRTISGEENAADTWASWYAHTGVKLKRAGIALLRLDHSGKDTTKGQRGSSAKAGDVDLVLQLVADGDRIELLAQERRQAYYAERTVLRRHEVAGALTHETTDHAGAVDAKMVELIAYLDGEGFPADVGRPMVKAHLDERGMRVTKRTLEAVLRRRKAGMPNGAGQVRQGGRFGPKLLPAGSGQSVGQPYAERADQTELLPTELPTAPTAQPTAQPTARTETGTRSTTAHAAVSIDTGSGQAAPAVEPLTSVLKTCGGCGKPAQTDPWSTCRRDKENRA